MKLAALLPSRPADLALGLSVAAVVGILVVPLPAAALDALLALNLALSAALLLAALNARNALELGTFPTMLLLTTLFRLSLNVGSTRLSLSEAHAGQVIEAFGEFVVRGDYAVGTVLFAILTLVQFLVVAKGAERVAEVGARFNLDAMPGKQMAIDSDLRSGACDLEGARARRRDLERESQLYGAMDGAMKFVKGDAVAGLLIVLVNALGGMAVGIFGRGLGAAEAARTYTLLAIGDGLVSRIPALCIAVSAGLVVTRVGGEESTASLGREMARQLFARPQGLGVVAALLAVLGAVPGMPGVPFFALAGAAAWGAFHFSHRADETAAEVAQRAPAATVPAGAGTESGVGPSPVSLLLDATLAPLTEEEGGRLLTRDLPALREALFAETGVRIPGLSVRLGEGLGPGAYRLCLDEVPCARGRLEPSGRYLCLTPEEATTLGLDGRPFADPCGALPLWHVDADAATAAARRGLSGRDARQLLLDHLARELRRRASAFLGIQEVQTMLDALEKSHPALVREATQRVPPPLLAEILRRLVDEGVSVRSLRGILEALCEPGTTGDALALAERCRRALRRHLSHRYAGEGTLYAHLANPELEELLREAVRSAPEPGSLALAPDDAVAILDGLRGALGAASEAVILASPDVRRYLKKLCEASFPQVAVLTYAELEPELQIRPLGRIGPTRLAQA